MREKIIFHKTKNKVRKQTFLMVNQMKEQFWNKKMHLKVQEKFMVYGQKMILKLELAV